MKTMFADFNAMTESEHVRLTTRGSQDDMERLGIKPGEWVWLSDGEMQVGARVDVDPRYGLIGIPEWDTLVDLIDDPPVSLEAVEEELRPLLKQNQEGSPADERRLFQLLTWWQLKSPNADQGSHLTVLRKAIALTALGHFSLALLTLEDGFGMDPSDEDALFLYIQLLINIDLSHAQRVAEKRIVAPRVSARMIALYVNILSMQADRAKEQEFVAVCHQVLDWSQRFESAPGRQNISPFLLGLVRFSQGLAQLGIGAVAEARAYFQQAQNADPEAPFVADALKLDSYGTRAQALARHFHKHQSKPIAPNVTGPPVAA